MIYLLIIILGVLAIVLWELYSINKHLDLLVPDLMDRIDYLENRQAPHSHNTITEDMKDAD